MLLIMTTLYLTESLPQNQRYRRDFVDDSSLLFKSLDEDFSILFGKSEYLNAWVQNNVRGPCSGQKWQRATMAFIKVLNFEFSSFNKK